MLTKIEFYLKLWSGLKQNFKHIFQFCYFNLIFFLGWGNLKKFDLWFDFALSSFKSGIACLSLNFYLEHFLQSKWSFMHIPMIPSFWTALQNWQVTISNSFLSMYSFENMLFFSLSWQTSPPKPSTFSFNFGKDILQMKVEIFKSIFYWNYKQRFFEFELRKFATSSTKK